MRYTYWLIAIVIVAASGCEAPPAEPMQLPANFVQLKSPGAGYELRAVSAEGVVIGLRRQDNPKNGTLEFWSKAVQKELATRDGYKLIKSEQVATDAGHAAALMTFEVAKEATQLTYMAAVFIADDKVLVAEGGGETAAVEAVKDDLRKSLLSAH